MKINNLKINGFGKLKNKEIKLEDGINIIYGKNAQGKTNLLESIYVLGITKSHRNINENNLYLSVVNPVYGSYYVYTYNHVNNYLNQYFTYRKNNED